MILYQCVQRLIDRGCEVFHEIIVVTIEQPMPEIALILMVSEFADVNLDEVS